MRFGLLFIGILSFSCISGQSTSARLGSVPNALHRYTFQHPQMGTVFRLVFYTAADSLKAAGIAQDVFARIDTLNAVFSDWLPESELNRLCQKAGNGEVIPVSAELFDIIRLSKKFSKKSAGAFDITVGPLTRLWRRSRSLKELPDSVHLAEATAKVGWANMDVFPRRYAIRLKKPGMGLDLGGIAQGWTADDCLNLLKRRGIYRAMVDAGGDIALGKAPPGEKGWKIEIPTSSGVPQILYLQHCGITTSGATYRYLELNGKRYSHIIDPRTGMAMTHHTLVTVLAPNATIADAWATAVSVLGESGRKRAQRSHKKLEIWLTQTPL